MRTPVAAMHNTFPRLSKAFAVVGAVAAFGSIAPAEAKYRPFSEKFPKAVGEHTLAMVNVQLEGQEPLPFGTDVVNQVTFGEDGSVADYFEQATFGKLRLTGEVFGTVTLPADTIDENCSRGNFPGLGWAANQAVQESTGRDLSEFNLYGYTLPLSEKTEPCDFGGLASGNEFTTLLSRYAYKSYRGYYDKDVVIHELGHTFGLSHANSIDCHGQSGRRITYNLEADLDGRCETSKYGDPVDPMGKGGDSNYGTQPDMSAINKVRLGVMPKKNMRTMEHDGIAHIYPLELDTDQVQLVRIPTGFKINKDRHFIYLDIREAYGLDGIIPGNDPQLNRVALREAGPIVDPYPEGGGTLGSYTNFIDTTPETPTYADGTLAAGKTYRDSSTGLTIKTLYAGPNGATVKVSGLDANRPKPKAID